MKKMRRNAPRPVATMINISIVVSTGSAEQKRVYRPKEEITEILNTLPTLPCTLYRIAGNFRGRKHAQIGEKYDFLGENFRGLLAHAVPKDTMPPNFAEKTFANSHKTVKFTKVFSPR